jgi:glycolate oxidase FAD binding subunit
MSGFSVSTATETLPISETHSPASDEQVSEIVRDCHASETAVYPIGGGTSLGYGLAAKRDGVGLSTSGLDKVIDYPARDMTITVGAGVTMQAIAETLAAEKQRLPLDVPAADQATIGGVVATNSNGPRRYGQGTVRDHVIGIQAVDGRGLLFKGGGRVVKNVAGYDFCKLLTGSLGTLGVMTQLTLKLKPQPEQLAFALCAPADLDEAEKLLAALIDSQTTPCAIELLRGTVWNDDPAIAQMSAASGLCLAIAFEGTATEVEWMTKQLVDEWSDLGIASSQVVLDEAASELMSRLAEFSAAGESPLVLQANIVPSGTTRFVSALRELDENCSVQAHAGNGVVIARLSEFPPDGLAKTLIGQLHPVAAAAHGHVTVLSNPSSAEMTHQSAWGAIDAPVDLMTAVKREFDPKSILNPERFIYLR